MRLVLFCLLLANKDNYLSVMSPKYKWLIGQINKALSSKTFLLPRLPALQKGTNYSLLTLSFPLLKAQTDTW